MPFDRSLFLGGWQLGDQEVQEDRALLPPGVVVGKHGREKGVGAHESLGTAFELHLAVLVEIALVDRYAAVEDRVELVALGTAEVALDEVVDLLVGIDLGAVQVRL